jgi:hypothetical protein
VTDPQAAVRRMLEDRRWSVQTVEGLDGLLLTVVQSGPFKWPVLLGALGDGPSHLVIQSILPVEARVGELIPVTELLMRLNDGLVDGAYELNFDDGSIRLRTSVPIRSLLDLDESTLAAWAGELVDANVTTVEQHLPTIVSVIHGGVDPASAAAGPPMEGLADS